MDKLYLAAVTIFGIGWYIEQRIFSNQTIMGI
jgi:hypothetical protein